MDTPRGMTEAVRVVGTLEGWQELQTCLEEVRGKSATVSLARQVLFGPDIQPEFLNELTTYLAQVANGKADRCGNDPGGSPQLTFQLKSKIEFPDQ